LRKTYVLRRAASTFISSVKIDHQEAARKNAALWPLTFDSQSIHRELMFQAVIP